MSLDDSEIMNYLVRMVVPMRREFGRKLDVGQFMHDFSYAAEVLEQARVSVDPRLREYALYVEKRMHGARIADSTPPVPTPAPAPAARSAAAPAAPAPAPAADKATEDELRARVLKKYTSGLR
jgi:hypothetical protein